MKKLEMWELPKCDTDMKWEDVVGKMAPVDLLNIGLPQTFNLFKKKKKPDSLCYKADANTLL